MIPAGTHLQISYMRNINSCLSVSLLFSVSLTYSQKMILIDTEFSFFLTSSWFSMGFKHELMGLGRELNPRNSNYARGTPFSTTRFLTGSSISATRMNFLLQGTSSFMPI